jgi:tRNA(Arg) A34 adenosine deaminase TadA
VLEKIKSRIPYVANKFTIHAEQDCIRKCPKNIINKCIMILVKITNLDNVAPCEMCAKLIKKYKIKKIYCFSCNE